MGELLFVREIVGKEFQGRHPRYMGRHERWRLMRLLGSRGKQVLLLDEALHWQLRQSVEGYLGYMLYSLFFMMSSLYSKPESWTHALDLCAAVGLSLIHI